LLRLVSSAGIVVIAYLVKTISPVRRYFFGGMFYGTFLLFTLTVLSLFFESVEETIRVRGYCAVLVKYAALGLLLLAAVTSVDRFSPVQFGPAASADLRAVSARIITAIFSAAESKHRQVMVYVPSPFPINSHYIQLALTMQRIDAIGG
jgi:hypothetical protein